MRYFILLFILLFFVISSIGQEIKYTLYLQNPCTNKLENEGLYSYYLEKDSLKYEATIFDDKTITIPSFGEYDLIAESIGEKHKVIINQNTSVDTLMLPKIQELFITHSKRGYIFRNCEGVIDKRDTSYYSNGNIRLTADFKKGYVIGELKEYFQNGDTKRVSNYNKKGLPINETTYYQNGVIKEETLYGKKGKVRNKTLYNTKGNIINKWNYD